MFAGIICFLLVAMQSLLKQKKNEFHKLKIYVGTIERFSRRHKTKYCVVTFFTSNS